MDIKIVIPTLERINNQITYNNLPLKYKKNVYFIVREHERKEITKKYKEAIVLTLPKNVEKGIGPTREWIMNFFKNDKIFVCDDDLTFLKREINQNKKLITNKMLDNDFDDLFNLILQKMNEGFVHGGLGNTISPPSIKYYPLNINARIMTNVFYNCPKLPKNINYSRCHPSEDFDANLQLLKKGFKNILFTNYIISEIPYKTGGCETYRTLDVHNDAQKLLKKLHPNFVKLKEKEVKKGKWKGLKKISVMIYWKKAYKSSLCKECDEVKDGDFCDCNE
tara:strand:- start:918 stop:1754 length:837 start_codon:yes stop_codon:yes gene_type:complete